MSRPVERQRARRAPPSVQMDFACNDGDSGLWRGTVEALSVSSRSQSIDFELSRGVAPRLTVFVDDTLRFLRRRLPFQSSSAGVGNWCWNSYRMFHGDAAVLICAVVRSGKFSVDGATGDAACDLSGLLRAGVPHSVVMLGLLRMGMRARK